MESKKAEEIRKKAEADASKMLKEAEQKARLIMEEAKKKADAEAGKVIAEAQQKGRLIMEDAKKKADAEAGKPLKDAEQKARLIIEDTKKKADAEASNVIAQAEQKARQIIEDARKKADVEAKARKPASDLESKANKIIAEAEQKARQIIEEAERIAAAPAEQRPQQIMKAVREKALQEAKGKIEQQASFKKRIEIMIAPPVDFAQLEKLRISLQRLPDLRILSIGGSPAGGTQISMMTDKPAPVAESLRRIDIVQEAIEEEMLASHPLGDVLKKTMPGSQAKRSPDEQRVLVVLKRAP